jgi:Fe-S-cluster containining protein
LDRKPEILKMISAMNDTSCFRCGVCCVKFQVRLSSDAAVKLAAKLNLSLPEFIARYTDPRWPGENSCLIKRKNGACIFLERSGRMLTGCRIYAFRPQSCREWQAGPDKAECRIGRMSLLKNLKSQNSNRKTTSQK